MSSCILCGNNEGDEYQFARVRVDHETIPAEKGKKHVTVETLEDIVPISLCSACVKKAKLKSVLLTIPIAIGAAVVMTILSFFTARPNRDIRREVASLPVVVPAVAVATWLIGLTVYLPRPAVAYAGEQARKRLSLPLNTLLIPLEAAYYTRRKDGEVSADKLRGKTALRTDLAEALIPVLRGDARTDEIEALRGRTFQKEEIGR